MQHSEQPHVELGKARAAIEAMRNAKAFDEFEEQWKEFLRRIERVWNKASSHFGKSPKWNGWKGKTEGLRWTDPLLSYLVNARGADEHTVNEIVGRAPGGIGINPAEGNSLYVEHMEINNGQIRIKSPQRVRVDFIPARTTLLSISNRGRRPTFLGLAFKLIEEAEKTWRRINGPDHIKLLLEGIAFQDGEPVQDDPPAQEKRAA